MSTGYLGELINPLTTTLARFLELVYLNFHGPNDGKHAEPPPLVPSVVAAMIERCSEFGVRDPGGEHRPGGSREEDYQAVYDGWRRLRRDWPAPGLLIDTASFCGQEPIEDYDREGKYPILYSLYEPLQRALADVVQWTYEDMCEIQERLEPGYFEHDSNYWSDYW